MKKSVLFVIITVLFSFTLIAQSNPSNEPGSSQTRPRPKEKTIRLRLGAGVAISSSASQMKGHLIKAGFGDKVNAKYDWLHDNGNDFYPQVQSIPIVVELAIERRFSKQLWLGLAVGIDKSEIAKGYDRYGTTYEVWAGTYSIGRFVTIDHNAWYLSPQFSFDKSNGRFGFYGGPTFEFHSLDILMEGESPIYLKPTNVGAVMGIRAKIGRSWEWFAAYRFSQTLRYEETSTSFEWGDKIYTPTLPAGEINISHLRIGVAYQVNW